MNSYERDREDARRNIVTAEILRLDRLLRLGPLRRKLRPGERIAIGGALVAASRRSEGACEGYVDNGFSILGTDVCAMTGCHRTRAAHGSDCSHAVDSDCPHYS